MDTEKLKSDICAKIDSEREYIADIAAEILACPELGFKEYKTSELVANEAKKLGAFKRDGIAVTGVRAELGNSDSPINICLIGELDSVICQAHPNAAKDGAAHACGHNGQIAVLLGVMKALAETKIVEKLGGRVTFLAVPAEEMIDTQYRKQLKAEGKIKYYSGKQQLVSEGEFDDIDICMMVHAQPGEETAAVYLDGSSLGFVSSEVTFHGKAAHAGAFPWNGVNALNAAMLSMMNMHISRESYNDKDKVRIHPIITKGGEAANVVPDEVIMENTVRAANPAALDFAERKVRRAVQAACIATDASATTVGTPGYLPLMQSHALSELFASAAGRFVPEDKIKWGIDMIGSSDIGDISCLMPTIQPTVGGIKGSAHGADFEICDAEAAMVIPAKALAMTVIDLLCDNASKAKEIKAGFSPAYTKDEYLHFLDSRTYTDEFIPDK